MYFGDVGPKGYHMSKSRPSFMAQGSYYLTPTFKVQAAYTAMWLTGYDVDAVDPFRFNRRLNFRNFVQEFSVSGQYFLFPFDRYQRDHKWSPYVSAGVGVLRHNPKAVYNSAWYDLHPLGTEGQYAGEDLDPTVEYDSYSLTQFVVPVGLGLRYYSGDKWAVSLDVNYRFTFTDYLDDVGGEYAPIRDLAASGDFLMSSELAFRGRGGLENYPEPGSQRGDDRSTDTFMTIQITASRYIFR